MPRLFGFSRIPNTDMYAQEEVNYKGRVIAEVYGEYQAQLAVNNALDFDDLILVPVRLFEQNESVLGYWHKKFSHILVDEYQDTNRIQYDLIRLLATNGESDRAGWNWQGRSVFVVGDADQSIYSFRMDAATAAAEVDNTAAKIFQETGVRTVLFRPPGGYLNNGVAAYAKRKNYAVVMWSIDTKDYLQPAAKTLADRVIRQAHPGAIVLMHDGGGSRRRTVEALPMIIQRLRQQGYRFATVQELLAIQAGTLR